MLRGAFFGQVALRAIIVGMLVAVPAITVVTLPDTVALWLVAIVAAVSIPLRAIGGRANLIPMRIQQAALDQIRVSDALNGTLISANFSTVERLAHWIAGLRMFAAHPILGVGAGNYDAAYAKYALPDWPDALGYAHNYYINVAAETGILGFVAFLALTAATLYLEWRVERHMGIFANLQSSHRAIALGCLAPSWRWPFIT